MVTFLVVLLVLFFIIRNFWAILKFGFFLTLLLGFLFVAAIGNVWFNIDANFFIKPLLIVIFALFIGSALLGNLFEKFTNILASILRL